MTVNASALVIGEDSYLISTDLVYVWTDGVTFAPVDVPGAPALVWASGAGTVVIRPPGYVHALDGWYRRHGSVLIDPEHFAYAKTSEPIAEVITDEQGRDWLKLTGNGMVHTFARRPATVSDSIPLPGQ